MSAPLLFTGGQPLKAGKRIGRGGEGDVYTLEGRADQAVKVYTVSDGANREAKVTAMVRAGLAVNSSFVSFPSAIVTDNKGKFAGFLMRLVLGHQPIHHLYATLDRKTHFPNADFRFLVATATNVARSLADVHSRNCVIGDINHSGILVSDRATVALIDADSFQISDGSNRFLCKVGVPEYTPPELQGQSLDGIFRTINHDAFGLAVIIFQLLCLGRHPFIGSYQQGEMPQERAIKEYRFAYSRERQVGMKPPPGAVLLSDFPNYISSLFEAAFKAGSARPLATDWVQALKRLEADLKRCAVNNIHYFPSAAPDCPWCRMEKTIGMVPFLPPYNVGQNATPNIGGAFDLRTIWMAIEAVQLPSSTPPNPILPQLNLAPTIEANEASKKVATQRAWGLALSLGSIAVLTTGNGIWATVLLGVIGGYKLLATASDGEKFRKNLVAARRNWDNALGDWERRCGGPEVIATKNGLAAAKKELEGLPVERQRRLNEYQNKRQAFQLKAHLERFRIAHASIQGIGPSLTRALRSYGIESANDVVKHRVLSVNGIGEAKANSLIAWRRKAEQKFRFDPNPNAADAVERDRINREITDREAKLKASLSRGVSDLQNASQRTLTLWKTSDAALNRSFGTLKQAEVNSRIVNAGLIDQMPRIPPAYWLIMVLVPLIAFVVFSTKKATAPVTSAPIEAITPTVQASPPSAAENPISYFKASVPMLISLDDESASVQARKTYADEAEVIEELFANTVVDAIGRVVDPNGVAWIVYKRHTGENAFIRERFLKLAPTEHVDSCSEMTWPDDAFCRNPQLGQLRDSVNAAVSGIGKELDRNSLAELTNNQAAWEAGLRSCQEQAEPATCLANAHRKRLALLSSLNDRIAQGRIAPDIPSNGVGQVVYPAQLRGRATDLVTPDDYPSNALREGREGRSSVSLHINQAGRVSSCAVLTSSGHPDLDEATCRLLTRRARFQPAMDVNRAPVEADVERSINWTISP